MIKKSVMIVLSIIVVLFIATTVYAQSAEIDKSYNCLEEQTEDDCGESQNTILNAFNLMAMAHDSGTKSDCRSELNSKEKDDNCWSETESSNTCTIKASAIATLALEHINKDIDDEIDWLITKKTRSGDLDWFLEIDANNKTECTINGQKITIGENKKISGSNPSGLKKAFSNYWLEITDIRKNYTVSCDSDFVTTLVFRKPQSSVYFVSSLTHSASAGDEIEEFVNGYCFGMTDNRCDYEGSLWATLTLSSAGEDISPYMPYLVALADDPENKKYLPQAFLYMLDNSVDEYLQELLEMQKQGKFWKESDDKLYDTSIALMALQNIDVDAASGARDYLLSIRETSGCWRTHTSLILFSGWPKSPSSGGDSDPSRSDCTVYSNFCVSRGECSLNNSLDNFDCPSISEICCAVEPVQLTCEQKDGIICADEQECSILTIPASDTTSCCLDSCQVILPPENECENNGGFCRSECSKGEIERSVFEDSCAFDEMCCFADEDSSPFNWWLIILLIILIILVIFAIIFRNQLKIWWFKVKTKFKSKKVQIPSKRPMPPPNYGRRSVMPRHIIPRPAERRSPGPRTRPHQQNQDTKRSNKDKEFNDTMKRLKDMSK
ncbi:hypothetical protein GOV12_07335 [Candidatus Pacearchaeota archaeon]|nr:hypothetical protein [Candidatus Pacearchaeota archaeon]